MLQIKFGTLIQKLLLVLTEIGVRTALVLVVVQKLSITEKRNNVSG